MPGTGTKWRSHCRPLPMDYHRFPQNCRKAISRTWSQKRLIGEKPTGSLDLPVTVRREERCVGDDLCRAGPHQGAGLGRPPHRPVLGAGLADAHLGGGDGSGGVLAPRRLHSPLAADLYLLVVGNTGQQQCGMLALNLEQSPSSVTCAPITDQITTSFAQLRPIVHPGLMMCRYIWKLFIVTIASWRLETRSMIPDAIQIQKREETERRL